MSEVKYIEASYTQVIQFDIEDLEIGLKSDIRLLNAVIERCYAQQELINLRSEQIIGLN